MRKLIIIAVMAGGLTLLVLATWAFRSAPIARLPPVLEDQAAPIPPSVAIYRPEHWWNDQPQQQSAPEALPGGRVSQREAEKIERQAQAAADAEAKRKAAEAEQQRRAAEPKAADITEGPGTNNVLFGRDGWVGRNLTEGPRPGNEAAGADTPGSPVVPNKNSQLTKMRELREALDELPKGKIVLDAPQAMKVGDTRAVYANVGINVPIEVLRTHSRPTDQSHEAILSVSSEMAATLTGPGFAITPTTPEQQGVAEGFLTVWSWNVEAKQEGEQELEATLYVLLPVGDKSTRQRIDSYTHKIGVSVKQQSWAEWLKSSKEEIDAVKTIVLTLEC